MPAKNTVFIDPQVSDHQNIIDGLNKPVEVLILDRESDGLTQMAGHMKGRSGIDAIHVTSHFNAVSATGNDLITGVTMPHEVHALAT